MRKRYCSKEFASGLEVDPGQEAVGEWKHLVAKLQHQLAPIVELSDAPGEGLGHRQPEEDAAFVVLEEFEGLGHGLGDSVGLVVAALVLELEHPIEE